jgi:hypothetical protein
MTMTTNRGLHLHVPVLELCSVTASDFPVWDESFPTAAKVGKTLHRLLCPATDSGVDLLIFSFESSFGISGKVW